jgi:hypothetical protein
VTGEQAKAKILGWNQPIYVPRPQKRRKDRDIPVKAQDLMVNELRAAMKEMAVNEAHGDDGDVVVKRNDGVLDEVDDLETSKGNEEAGDEEGGLNAAEGKNVEVEGAGEKKDV